MKNKYINKIKKNILTPWTPLGVASNSEHLPVFRVQRMGEGRSTPVHGQGTHRTSPATQKNRMGRGQQITDKQTDMRRFGENFFLLMSLPAQNYP